MEGAQSQPRSRRYPCLERAGNTARPIPSPAQLQALLARLDANTGLLVKVLALTDLRISEAIARKWSESTGRLRPFACSADGIGATPDTPKMDTPKMPAGTGWHCFRRLHRGAPQQVGTSSLEAVKLVGHVNTAVTEKYTFVHPITKCFSASNSSSKKRPADVGRGALTRSPGWVCNRTKVFALSDPAMEGAKLASCYFCVTCIAMRRFCARPCSVELSATGYCSP